MAERRRLWTKHNGLDSERPMILAESCGVMDEITPHFPVECRADWARGLETRFRSLLFQHHEVDDDGVLEPWLDCPWRINVSHFGVTAEVHRAESEDGQLGARNWDPPLKNLQEDFGKLKPRTFTVNREATHAWKAHLEKVVGDDEAAIRADLRRTLDVTRGCPVEIVMKDVHTVKRQPERLGRWVAIAREEIAGG